MLKRLQLFLAMQVLCTVCYAQQFTLKGKVTAEDTKETIAGVSIRVKGSPTTIQTNLNGLFSLHLERRSLLEVSFIGYATQIIAADASNSFLEIRLAKTEESLKEVIITSYSRDTKRTFTGSASVLGASKINQVPVGSFEHALQGQLPGVYVTAGSGQPGAPARVIIRGVGTINGVTNPLYVVDNIPLEGNNNFNYGINTSDIESITVLKDAVATALYGSRGSNGVVLVTTKKGNPGALKLSFNTQFGMGVKNTSKYSMMSTAQRLQFEEEVGLETVDTWSGAQIPGWNLSDKNPANANISAAQALRNANILDSLKNINTNWLDVFFKDAQFQEHNLSASGGNEKLRFFSSANYYNQDGVGLRSYLKRYSVRNNLQINSGRLTANFNLGLSYNRSSVIESENASSSVNPFAAAYFALPYEQPYVNGFLYDSGNAKSSPVPILDQREGSTALERLQDATNTSDLIKALVGGNLQYKITPFLSASTFLGLDFRDVNQVRTVLAGTSFGATAPGGSGFYNEINTRNIQYISTSGLNFQNTWNNKHQLELKAFFEVNRLKFRSTTINGFGINPKLNNTPAGVGNGSTNPSTISGSKTESGLLSWLGIAKYTYNNRYSVSMHYRYDGSSTVGKSNTWTGFYSAGLNWDVKKEHFLEDVNFINSLNLRASYGKTASPFNPLLNFNYVATYESTKYNNSQGIIANSPGNADYDWEFTHQLDLGTDIALINNRVTASIDWYHKLSYNLFTNQPLSATSGFSSYQVNAGSMRNNGIDISARGEIIRSRSWRFTLGTNVNYNKNKIVDIGQLNEFVLGTTIVRKGLPFGTQYTVKWAGVDPQTGDAQYYNRDGSITTNYDPTNQSVAVKGSYIPPFQGGFDFNLRYKDIYLTSLFSFATKYYRYNNEPLYNESPSFGTSNKSTVLLNRWRKPGDITNVQRYEKNSARRLSSKDVEDASYLKLRNVRLNYSLPKKITSKARLTDALIYLQGQNLYTWTKWTGFDPEDNNNIAIFEYPTYRTYTIGLNINF